MYNFGLIGLAWLAAHFVYGVDFSAMAEGLAALIAAYGARTLICVGFIAVALPVVSLVFRGIGSYGLMYLLDKLFFWFGQTLVALVSLAAVVFWFEAQVNLWVMSGALASAPFLALASGAFCLKLFDFNYPVKDALVNSLTLPVGSFLIIWGSRFLFHF